MVESPPTAFLIFVKYPEVGRVKTRLARQIGAGAAAALYREWVDLCLFRYRQVTGADCIVYYSPPEDITLFEKWLGLSHRLVPQPPGDLGHRLQHGFSSLLPRYSCVIALGTDSPDLPVSYLEQAVLALRNNEVVLGPADDGGYYLIGCSRPVPELFQGIPWSTSSVTETTLSILRSKNITHATLPPWYDIDGCEDLQRFLAQADPITRRRMEDVLADAKKHLA